MSNIGQETNMPDINEIPVAANTRLVTTAGVNYVMLDLETGGLSRSSDILQISAICGQAEFNWYIIPLQSISKGASDVTKLSIVTGALCFEGNPVNTVSPKEGLIQLISFLKGMNTPVLVGHNIRTFDLMVLYHHMNKFKLWNHFVSVDRGFVDTKAVLKKEFPKQHSCAQTNLMNDLLNEVYPAHNASDDVKALQKLSELVSSKFPSYTVGIG